MNTIIEKQKEIPVRYNIDVAIIGGGTAGTVAAIAAARLGMDVLIVERQGSLGGVATTGLMASIANKFYDSHFSKIMGGIPFEVMERLVEEGGTKFPSMDETMNSKLVCPFTIPFQPEKLSYVLLKMAKEAGVKTLLHTHFSHMIGSGENPEGFVAVNKSGQSAILAKVMIDASGDADLAAAAGAPCIKPDFTWGLLMRMGDVDHQKVLDALSQTKEWEPWPEFTKWLSEHLKMTPEEIKADRHWHHLIDPLPFSHAPSRYKGDGSYSPEKLKWIQHRWETEGIYYNIETVLYRRQLKKAVEDGEFELVKDIPGFGKIWLGFDGFAGGAWGQGVALMNVCSAARGFDGTNGEHVSMAEVEGRLYSHEIARFFNKYVPGFENAYILDISSQFVPRAARSIIGQESAPSDEKGKKPDTIYLFRDLYNPESEVREIPYSVLVPQKINNILVAGKCASEGIKIRSMSSCMAMGQAAGTAAYLMIKEGKSNNQVDIDKLRQLLIKNGAILEMPV